MHESQQQYIGMNQVLVAAARRHSEVTIVDWNTYSRDQPSWFQDDGIHLFYDGAIGMATLLHASLLDALAEPLVVASAHLPVAHVGRAYSARLLAARRDGAIQVAADLRPATERAATAGRRPDHGHPTPERSRRLVFRTTDASARTANASTTLVVDDS